MSFFIIRGATFFFSLPNVLVTNDREAFFKLYVVDLLLSSNEVDKKDGTFYWYIVISSSFRPLKR
jgi:hypothetical protein